MAKISDKKSPSTKRGLHSLLNNPQSMLDRQRKKLQWAKMEKSALPEIIEQKKAGNAWFCQKWLR